ncbi:MAG: hypothetical protein K0U84_18595 [Actinomycetia bacterium]|nr:hypothetical protein [Actinomycetes bacterium]
MDIKFEDLPEATQNYVRFRATKDPIEAFNLFIRQWVSPAMHAHLLDDDDNDAQWMRDRIEHAIQDAGGNPPDRVFIDDRGHRWEWCGGEQGTWAWRMTTTSMPGASRVHPVVPCPTCYAPAGLACEDADGYRQPQAPHPARIEAFYDTTEYRGQ